jgi:Pyruvate/2-oxoacid:ferredoxin oxidoreductase delta subunit
MQCTAVCPNDALSGATDFLALLREVAATTSVLLSCQKGMLGPDHIRIPCVGMFSEAMLAALNAVTPQECYLDISGCADCVNSHCLPILEKMMAKLAAQLPDKGKIRLKYHLNRQSPLPCSAKNERRSILRLFGKNITALSKEAFSITEPCPDSQTPGHGKKQPRTAAALLHALAVLDGKRNPEKTPLLSYFFSAATTDRCDICPLCTGMCPTGALQRKKEAETTALTFTSARCSGCGLCAVFCKKNALTIMGGFPGDPNAPQQVAVR